MARGGANWFGVPGELPPELQLLQLIAGEWAHRAVYAAAELGIADHLAEGAQPSAEVARKCGTDEHATYRLMRALANIGVLEERDRRSFALTPVGECLRSDAPRSVRDFARFVGYEPSWRAWGDVL